MIGRIVLTGIGVGIILAVLYAACYGAALLLGWLA